MKRLRAALGGLLLLSAAGLALPVPAQDVQRIAAIVNDDVVSARDIERRLDLVIRASGQPDNLDSRRRLRERVLRNLIDERLQLQEAQRRNIKVSDAELDRHFAFVAQQNNLTPERFEEQLRAGGVSREELTLQFQAELAWGKLVRQRILPTINVSDEEVQAAVARLREQAGQTEYLVSEIFLSIDQPDQEDEARRLAERLVDQVRRGTPFPVVARQFSQGSTAANGGAVGWVQLGTLPEEVDEALRRLERGQISEPIRTATGIYIVAVGDRRQILGADPGATRLTLKQIMLPLPPGDEAGRRARLEQLREAAASLTSCDDVEAKGKTIPGASSGSLGTVRQSDLPPNIRAAIADVGIGKASAPIETGSAAQVLAVCAREEAAAPKLDADQIRIGLVNRRADMMQRRYLRDLRRDASLEIR